jgi:ABC-type uncharacterized transport system auxiliary subunit
MTVIEKGCLMSHWIKTILVCVVLVFFAGACLNFKQPRNRIQHYTLEYASPELTDLQPLPVSIKVERFSVAAVYNTTRIIYREGAFKRDEYYYHKWRANPADMVTDFLTRDIRHSGRFKAVLSYGSDAPFSYTVEGSVDEFLEWDGPEGWKAVLGITVALMAGSEPDVSERVLFQKSYWAEKPVTEKNPNGLAQAMSAAMADISAAVIRDIHTALAR